MHLNRTILQHIQNSLRLCLLLGIVGIWANEKKMAQDHFASGEYKKAYLLFSKVYSDSKSSHAHQKNALSMKALLSEQYLGNLDSALIFYQIYLQRFCRKTREQKRVREKIIFLQSIEEKEAYETYQKAIFTTSSDRSRTNQLLIFIKNNPRFFLKREALKQCAIAALNYQNYAQAFASYTLLKKEYIPLTLTEKRQYDLTKRMYFRYRLIQFIFIIWIITAILLLTRVTKSTIAICKLKVAYMLGWGTVLSVFLIIYATVIVRGSHNPFRIEDIILLSLSSTGMIFFNILFPPKGVEQTIFTTLTIIGTAYFITYNRPNRIMVMDDLYEQLREPFTRRGSGKTGQNTQN